MLYDEQAELERAYAAWLEAGDASDFQTWGLSQRIVPTALSEGVAYFLTTVERPVGNFIMEQQRIGSAFDRETGEYIEAWELFTCPPDEAVRRILDLSELTEPEQRAEMEAAFEPECLTFFEDRLEVSFDRRPRQGAFIVAKHRHSGTVSSKSGRKLHVAPSAHGGGEGAAHALGQCAGYGEAEARTAAALGPCGVAAVEAV